MSTRYSAAYWKDRADEARVIRENMSGEGPRHMLAQIAADYDRLHDWTLKQSGSLRQAIEDLISSPFSAATREREPKE
jgi:hypothetical protein